MSSHTMPSFTAVGITEEVEARMRCALKEAIDSIDTFLNSSNDVDESFKRQLGINKDCHDMIMKRLKKRKSTSMTFDGDDFPTSFDLRDGKLFATEPKYPFGREVVLSGSISIGKPLSLKGLLMMKMHESDPEGEYATSFDVLCRQHNCGAKEAVWAYTSILAVNSFAIKSGWKLSGTTKNMKVHTEDPMTRPEHLAFQELMKTSLVFATNQSEYATDLDITEKVHVNEDPE